MAIRLIECHRILKGTGSIYLHCDPKMSHYLKLVLDCIFGEKTFRNEIIWHYHSGRGPKKGYNKKHDIILFYTKTQNFYDFQIRQKSYKTKPNLKKEEEGVAKIGKGSAYFYWDKEKQKHYSLVQMHDVWNDIGYINSQAKERTGYPTQKPLALLERIIKKSCPNEGIVLDPFCGCATTCVAAEKLERKWIGIDVSHKAYELVQERLKKEVHWSESGELIERSLQKSKKITLLNDPPKRTDQEKTDKDKKFVYIISNENYKNEYKVGVAKNPSSRLNNFQTYDPNRSYKMEYKLETTNFNEIEKAIHNTFPNRYEWVKGHLEEIKSKIEELDATL